MREIKGPEDCKPHIANLFTEEGSTLPIPNGVFTAQEVAQIIDLALEAGSDRPSPELLGYERYDRRERNYQAWRELAERLKGNECRCTRCGHEVCVC